jgi:hypothetical protein
LTDDTAQEEGDDGLQALLGTGPIPFPERSERKFQPWHKPRKQYVRRMQWRRELGFLIRDIGDINELRYLTLPGSDLLDIRYLADSICRPKNICLKYLGFNTAASPSAAGQADFNNGEYTAIRHSSINRNSRVYGSDFREAGTMHSLPWMQINNEKPFHAINLDLCGGFAGKEKGAGLQNYFTALKVLLQHQREAKEEFLLFITTRMDDDNVDSQNQEKLTSLAQTIYDTCSTYSSEFNAAWGITTQPSLVKVSEEVEPTEAFMLGLTQWIVGEGISLRLKASVRTFMTYRTGSMTGEDDIVSLAIRFKPDPVIEPDSSDLVHSTVSDDSERAKHCQQSSPIPKKVKNREHVDAILRQQADEFEQCITESSELLAKAGYDSGSYREWVMAGLN